MALFVGTRVPFSRWKRTRVQADVGNGIGGGPKKNTTMGICMGEIWDRYYTGWWFGTFFIFHNIWDNPSH